MHQIQKSIKLLFHPSPVLLSGCFISKKYLSDSLSQSKESCEKPETILQNENHDDVVRFQNSLFDATKKKQLSEMVPRLEKVEVRYQGRGISDSAVMFMNKHLSTPHHCAMHISKTVADSAALAVLTPSKVEESSTLTKPLRGTELTNPEDTEKAVPQPLLWDIYRPIPCDCQIEILKFNMENSTEWHHQQVNRAYWNSCSLILGAVMQKAFKKNYEVGFYHLPRISEKKGAFCYDIVLDEKLNGWEPNENDLVYFTKVARSIIAENYKFERLEVNPEIALKMFENDRYQCDRIQSILDRKGPGTPIVLYRVGQYIDVTAGPHIASTSLMYHYVVVAFHRLFGVDEGDVRRVQGISLPKDLRVQHSIWSMLESRARRLVKQDIKGFSSVETADNNLHSTPFKSIENKTKQYMISTSQWREGAWKDTKESFNPENKNT